MNYKINDINRWHYVSVTLILNALCLQNPIMIFFPEPFKNNFENEHPSLNQTKYVLSGH